VVTPAGRIVVGEFFLDPDYVSPARLDALARAAGSCCASDGARTSRISPA
jgi:hypothetical protein